MIVVFFFFFMTTSCGMSLFDIIKRKGKRPPVTTHEDFVSHIKKFKEYAEAHGVGSDMNVPIIFGDFTNLKTVGLCYEYEDGDKMIEIKEEYWKDEDEGTRESLILHEIGHCFLNRNKHILQEKGDSLMNKNVVPGENYVKHRDYYLKELFKKEPPRLLPQS